jgi:hypothetical protein
MHDLEPYHRWRDLYIASEDMQSPFFRRKNSEVKFTHKIYNYYIHPQWDSFGSETLFLKVLFADYDEQYAIIEFIGEWNDTLHNDIMLLKRGVLEDMMESGIKYFILVCDNLLNFHASDTDYYEEWAEELRDHHPAGWAVFVNTHQHVAEEMEDGRLDNYVQFGEQYNDLNWRILKPNLFRDLIEDLLANQTRRIGTY